MPIYEYRCPNGHTFEVFQRISDPAVGSCEICGAGPVEKVLFPVAVHFKGSGFYSTDYGKGGRKPKESDAGEKGEKKDAAPPKTDSFATGDKSAGTGDKKAAAAD